MIDSNISTNMAYGKLAWHWSRGGPSVPCGMFQKRSLMPKNESARCHFEKPLKKWVFRLSSKPIPCGRVLSIIMNPFYFPSIHPETASYARTQLEDIVGAVMKISVRSFQCVRSVSDPIATQRCTEFVEIFESIMSFQNNLLNKTCIGTIKILSESLFDYCT